IGAASITQASDSSAWASRSFSSLSAAISNWLSVASNIHKITPPGPDRPVPAGAPRTRREREEPSALTDWAELLPAFWAALITRRSGRGRGRERECQYV